MPVVYDDQPMLLDWAAQTIGIARFRPDAKAIGMVRHGVIQGVAAYDSFSPADCNMHIASNGAGHWLTRDFAVKMFAFPFIQCGLRRVTGLIAARNTVCQEFAKHMGFQYEGLCQHALPDDDIVVLGLLRERCKFLPKEHRHA